MQALGETRGLRARPGDWPAPRATAPDACVGLTAHDPRALPRRHAACRADTRSPADCHAISRASASEILTRVTFPSPARTPFSRSAGLCAEPFGSRGRSFLCRGAPKQAWPVFSSSRPSLPFLVRTARCSSLGNAHIGESDCRGIVRTTPKAGASKCEIGAQPRRQLRRQLRSEQSASLP